MTTSRKGADQGALERPQHLPNPDLTSRSREARDTLRDAVVAAGIPTWAGVAILSAAESYAKASLRDEFAALADELEHGRAVAS